MEELVDRGIVRALGVDGMCLEQIQRIEALNLRIPPAVNMIESHPIFAQRGLVEYCQSVGMVCVAWSPLCSGGPIQGISLVTDPVVHAVAAREKCTAAQVCLRFNVDRGIVCIPRPDSAPRPSQNYRCPLKCISRVSDPRAHGTCVRCRLAQCTRRRTSARKHRDAESDAHKAQP